MNYRNQNPPTERESQVAVLQVLSRHKGIQFSDYADLDAAFDHALTHLDLNDGVLPLRIYSMGETLWCADDSFFEDTIWDVLMPKDLAVATARLWGAIIELSPDFNHVTVRRRVC